MASSPVSLSALLGGHAARRPPAADPPDRDPDEDDAAAEAAGLIVQAGQRLDRHGWVLATAGNISLRLADGRIAITRSGCHKGMLTADDVMLVNQAGDPLTDARPSAETLLHCQIYQQRPDACAVLHGHSVAATVLSMQRHGDITLRGYEVLKAFGGPDGSSREIRLPVVDNDQDIGRLARTLAPEFGAGLPAGYVIRGHGVYAWGPDMPTALVRLEALEFLLACELEKAKLR